MNGLTSMKPVIAGLALLVSAILVAGCDKEAAKLAFNHNLHVRDNGMACADCHGKVKDGHFATAGHEACKDCHGDWMDEKKVDESTCGKCHKVKNMKSALNALKVAPDKIAVKQEADVFVHTALLSNRCEECHGNLMDKKLVQVPLMNRETKREIRDKAHRSASSCDACHVDMDPKTPPPSHKSGWTQRHGLLSGKDEKACTICHTEPSCRECHQVTQPASHNNLWRLKTHGIQAAWNRQKCLVCHEVDSCSTCHAETKPQSHNAGWREGHCQKCHTSKERGTGCALCHEGTIDTHPNPHPGSFRSSHCNSCHPGSPQTEQCKVCHGGDLTSGHPNPHAAGFRASHCNTCHQGSPEARQCAICHGSDAHSNPHPAGWASRHCTSCHDATAQGCTQCHEGAANMANHSNPHAVGWRDQHCFSCHPSSSANGCTMCHPGGNNTMLHQDVWPPSHDRFGSRGNCLYCHEP